MTGAVSIMMGIPPKSAAKVGKPSWMSEFSEYSIKYPRFRPIFVLASSPVFSVVITVFIIVNEAFLRRGARGHGERS
jgi:hypothetical protein